MRVLLLMSMLFFSALAIGEDCLMMGLAGEQSELCIKADEYCYVTEGSYTCDKDRHKHRHTETLNADPNDMDIIDAMDMGE